MSSSTRPWAPSRPASRPTTSATTAAATSSTATSRLGYRTFHPGRVFRRWIASRRSYYRNYDFGGNRIGEYVYLDGKGQFLNYWTATLHLDYEPPKYSHYLTRGGPMAFYPSGETIRVTLSSDDRKPLVVERQRLLPLPSERRLQLGVRRGR